MHLSDLVWIILGYVRSRRPWGRRGGLLTTRMSPVESKGLYIPLLHTLYSYLLSLERKCKMLPLHKELNQQQDWRRLRYHHVMNCGVLSPVLCRTGIPQTHCEHLPSRVGLVAKSPSPDPKYCGMLIPAHNNYPYLEQGTRPHRRRQW